MQKLIRSWEAFPELKNHSSVLSYSAKQVWSEGRYSIPLLTLNEELEKSLMFARRCGHLKGGLEKIEGILAQEQKGLLMLRQGSKAPVPKKLSRLLLVSNDGSERLYRQLENLQEHHAERVLLMQINSTSFDFGTYFGAYVKNSNKPKAVKVLLIDKKDFVLHFFSKLIDRVEN